MILENIIVFLKNIEEITFGFVAIAIFLYLVCIFLFNLHTKCKYKRESNEGKFYAQRCYEDGVSFYDSNLTISKDEEDDARKCRDYFYLIDRKRFHRIVDTYTLSKLGYPKPSRRSEKCFKISDGYSIGKEIKIYNPISDIGEILKLK